MVLEYSFHGLPKYVGVELTEGNKSVSAEMLQNWMEKPVGWFGSLRPCAVMVFFWFGKPCLAKIWQFWNKTAPSPNMKSTVPVILHSL